MIARLLLALLLAAFALPGAAPAACHDTPIAHHAMPMPADMPDRQAAPMHGCIGCIPPSDWRRIPMVAAVAAGPVEPAAATPVRLTGGSWPPDLPPPRV